jgi:protein-tyrosine phosphatase
MAKPSYNFAAASPTESLVFGAAGPGTDLDAWIAFMQAQGIQRVCCLLPEIESLRDRYQVTFGPENLCWAAVEDFHVVEKLLLEQTVLPFLAESVQREHKVVVHCGGGIGRTGQVLAAWLVAGRDLWRVEAVNQVKQMGRDPYEAVMAAPLIGRNPCNVANEITELLESVQLGE